VTAAARPALVSVGEIEAGLVSNAERLCWELFPNGRVQGALFRIGNLRGDPGQSLFVRIGGAKAGNWRDMHGEAVNGRDRGDLLWLVACALFGGDLGKAVAWARSWLHLDDLDAARLERFKLRAAQDIDDRRQAARDEEKRNRASARRRWLMGLPIGGTIAETYLQSRGIDLRVLGRAPGALRFNPKVQYGFGDQAIVLPAMLAAITSLAGEHVATHRTWLKADGSDKAGAAEGIGGRPKKVLGLFPGAHIPLWKGACGTMPLRDIPEGTDVYVSEGIEDGLTVAMADPKLRVVSAVSLGNLAELELPRQMGWLIFIKQNDPPGSEAVSAFDRAIHAHRSKGRRVKVVMPPPGVKDFNDLLRYGPAGHRITHGPEPEQMGAPA